jgi:hypothetical protein
MATVNRRLRWAVLGVTGFCGLAGLGEARAAGAGIPAPIPYDCSATANACTQNMPLYDQRYLGLGADMLPNGAAKSQLCAPTAAAMILESQTYYTRVTNPSTGWIASHFQLQAFENRVRNLASLMSTSPLSGTMFLPWTDSFGAGKGVGGRKGDFAYGGEGSTSFWPTGVEGSDIEPLVRARRGVMMIHGHYDQDVTSILGTDYVTYWRDGGHYVAVSGFMRNDANPDNDTFIINNPMGGVLNVNRIMLIDGGTTWKRHTFLGVPYYTLEKVVILPVIAGRAGYLSQSGNRFKILEGYSQLGANR